MPDSPSEPLPETASFTEAEPALARIEAIYEASVARICDQVKAIAADGEGAAEIAGPPACYPFVAIDVAPEDLRHRGRFAYGEVPGPGRFSTTLTRPSLFRSYYLEQFRLLLENHGRPLQVGVSDRPIPVTFVVEAAEAGLNEAQALRLRERMPMPDLARIDDAVPNGTVVAPAGSDAPLALFSAERVDYSLVRLSHYTGTAPEHFQRFVLFTNYQRYVDEFVAYGREKVASGDSYRAFVEPGNLVTRNPTLEPGPGEAGGGGTAPRHLPQMPAYHLVRDRHEGITLINIGVGPSNAKTITDHLAVLRPHCWLMVGHCGGLRKTQRLGDYVLAHAYVRADNVLDIDLPSWVPVPPIAEVQIALTSAVGEVTGLGGRDLKRRLRTGTIYTTDDRDWELRHAELRQHFNQSRAIAVDMESATIAANGFRMRVPYGTLLCVSDKPLHGEIKLPSMADSFYKRSIGQHLEIGIAAIRRLREDSIESLHSRKLRSFDEPAFR